MLYQDYSLPFELIRLKDNTFPKLLAKEIICNRYTPHTKYEKSLKAISNCLNYLSDNVVVYFDSNLIIESYYLLTHKVLAKKRANAIVETYYEYINCSLEENLLMILETISKVIYYSKKEFAILISNYLFIKMAGYSIKITKNMTPIIQNMFITKENILNLIVYFHHYSKPKVKENYMSREEIFKFFRNERELLLIRFPIKRLFLFGSYADGMKNSHSDLDLLVIFNDEVTMMESLSLKNKLTDYIENQLKINVDIINFQYAMNYMDYMSLNKILTIY